MGEGGVLLGGVRSVMEKCGWRYLNSHLRRVDWGVICFARLLGDRIIVDISEGK